MSRTSLGLRVTNVSVAFGGIQALTDVNLDVERGHIVAVIGPNGAGKSTLLNAISGLGVPLTSGSVFIDDCDILRIKPSSRVRNGIGRSFQDPNLLEEETVLTNVLAGLHQTLHYGGVAELLRPNRVRHAERSAAHKAMSMLELASLDGYASRKAGELSYGARKLVDIVRAAVASPSVLLLDEPTSGMDAQEQRRVTSFLTELWHSTSPSILLVEHHMDAVRELASETLVLATGSPVVFGKTEQVLNSDEFSASVLGIPEHPSNADKTPAGSPK